MEDYDSSSEDEGGLKSLFAPRLEEDEKFYFADIVVSERCVTFIFRFCDDACFESKTALPASVSEHHMPTLFAMGMCVCAWYWMGYNTSSIVIEEAVCDKCHVCSEAMPFWNELYRQIALEYAYVNKIPLNVVTFVLGKAHAYTGLRPKSPKTANADLSSRALIPMGGGKDSLVVWHQYTQGLQASGESDLGSDCGEGCAGAPTIGKERPLLLYVADGMEEFSGSWRLQKLIAMTGDEVHLVRHDFQTQLVHRLKRSYLKPCAHPWAALVLFDSVLASQLAGVRQVQLGLERSADEGNGVFVEGQEVNHQFDKSSAFLAQAQAYIHQFIDPDMNVVSTLHGLWEIQIARIFCEAPSLRRFMSVFLSCNDPTEQCDWCKRCEKCAFIFLLLSAWLPTSSVVQTVFGGVDMLREEARRGLFRQLVGLEGAKPLDCVGTVAEASAAVHLAAVRCAAESAGEAACVHCSSARVCILPEGVVDTAVEVEKEVVACGECAAPSCHCAHAARDVPALLVELCAELGIEWDAVVGGPALQDPDQVLAYWGVDK